MPDDLNDCESVLRAMRVPTEWIDHLPLSRMQRLTTQRLIDSPVAAGMEHRFDDSCLITSVTGNDGKLPNLKLTCHPRSKPFAGVHLALLSPAGLVNVVVADDRARMFIGNQTMVRANIQMFSQPSLLIGDRSTIGGARLIVANCDMVIGEDAQFSDEIVLQGSDQHPIIDLSTGALLNGHRRHLHLDRHVWIGRRAMLLPDIKIGAGSIVAAGSVVSADVPSQVIVAGVPARIVREQVGWARDFGSSLQESLDSAARDAPIKQDGRPPSRV